MPIVFIDQKPYDLPRIFTAGSIFDEAHAALVNHIQHTRILTRLRYMLDKGKIPRTAEALNAKALELLAEPLSVEDLAYAEGTDPIEAEALVIAREMIMRGLAKDGIAELKGLDDHARALINAVPEINERAAKRVELRHRAAMEAINSLGG